jgi:hypothetical protein
MLVAALVVALARVTALGPDSLGPGFVDGSAVTNAVVVTRRVIRIFAVLLPAALHLPDNKAAISSASCLVKSPMTIAT